MTPETTTLNFVQEWSPVLLQLLGMGAVALLFVARMRGQTDAVTQAIRELKNEVGSLREVLHELRTDHEARLRVLETLNSHTVVPKP